ncbi:MAG: type II secretion system F family protein [Burkholderiaceae bacterium]|nr:type II secretion system F family protein [Microbacteriaceae bacterium]
MASETEYSFTGRNARDRIVRGHLRAGSRGVALSVLRSRGVSPISITVRAEGKGWNRDLKFVSRAPSVKLGDLAILSRQAATMTTAGLSLLRTLNILAEQTPNVRLARTVVIIRGSVESGISLSDALAAHPDVFPPMMINLVRAGETGGFLDDALTSCADNFESEMKLRDTIKSALAYPVVVLAMAAVAVVGMLVFVVPVFEGMFADLGGTLPLPTQVLVTLSRMMVWLVPLLVVVGAASAAWWRRNKRLESVRQVIDPLKLTVPIFGPLLAKLAVARFTRNLATMIGAGVPIVLSLRIVGGISNNWVVESALRRTEDAVSSGKSLAGQLQTEAIFPSMVTQMIAVGEESGELQTMLGKIADFYEQEVQTTSAQLASLIEPLMIAFIGVVIGGMIVALYLPLFSIFDFVQ